MGANTQPPSSVLLSAKEVRTAEAQAKTAEDDLRLAAWYRAEAPQNRGMAARTKIPNPYWNARAWARIYRENLQKATKLAADHQRMAESLH